MSKARPRLRVFAGPNGSGKSTIREVLRDEWIGVYVNADEIEKTLRHEGRLDLGAFEITAPVDELKTRLAGLLRASPLLERSGLGDPEQAFAWAGCALSLPAALANSYVAALLADFMRRELLRQGTSFTFETVMSSADKVAFMREAQALGYRTYLYFVATDDWKINLDRVRQRVELGGHPVPDDKLITRYHRSIDLLEAACMASNRAYIFDNSGTAHELIAEVTDGASLTIHANAIPAWFAATSLWRLFQTGEH